MKTDGSCLISSLEVRCTRIDSRASSLLEDVAWTITRQHHLNTFPGPQGTLYILFKMYAIDARQKLRCHTSAIFLLTNGWGKPMFEGFTHTTIRVSEAELNVRYGGNGPPVLLLHGHPRTHATWSKVAPELAKSFTVVCPDLRGFGGSSKPADQPDHACRSGLHPHT